MLDLVCCCEQSKEHQIDYEKMAESSCWCLQFFLTSRIVSFHVEIYTEHFGFIDFLQSFTNSQKNTVVVTQKVSSRKRRAQ